MVDVVCELLVAVAVGILHHMMVMLLLVGVGLDVVGVVVDHFRRPPLRSPAAGASVGQASLLHVKRVRRCV